LDLPALNEAIWDRLLSVLDLEVDLDDGCARLDLAHGVLDFRRGDHAMVSPTFAAVDGEELLEAEAATLPPD
jgi:hypothetical protein